MPVQTGITLDLRRSRHSADDVWSGGAKASALALLGALRDCGLNRDRDIEVHRAETYLWRFWVIGWPDHYNGITHLMTANGRWVPGRLYDASPCWCAIPCRAGHAAPWSRLPGNPGPGGWLDPANAEAYRLPAQPLVQFGEAGGRRIRQPLEEFARWVVSLDDPDPESAGFQDRRTVGLSQIVDRARQALGEES